MKEGAFLLIRKPRDSRIETAKYKQIDLTYVDGIVEWRVILLLIPWDLVSC